MSEHVALVQFVRAAAVLDGLDVRPADRGVLPAGGRQGPLITWSEISDLLGPDDPLAASARHRLALLITLGRTVTEAGRGAAGLLRRAARPVALPPGHPCHPGPDWVRARVPGGLLELGVGVVGLVPGQFDAVPLPRSVARAADLELQRLWPTLLERAERAGTDLVRVRSVGRPGAGSITTSQGCDALTLLTTGPVRRTLAQAAPDGVGRVSAPRRDRVWTGERATDRDHARAVWMLTPAPARGVLEPIPVTEGRVGAGSPLG